MKDIGYVTTSYIAYYRRDYLFNGINTLQDTNTFPGYLTSDT